MWSDERAVSPVIGVALLIAITVVLAAVAATTIFGVGTGPVGEPEATLSFEVNENGNVVVIHEGGEPLPEDQVVFIADGEVRLSEFGGQYEDDALTAGERVEIQDELTINEELTVVWESPRDDGSQVLGTFRP